MQSKIVKMLEERIVELQYDEWRAKEAKDYPACLYLYGAIMYFKKFLKEVKEIR
jgi:hypothetical protein